MSLKKSFILLFFLLASVLGYFLLFSPRDTPTQATQENSKLKTDESPSEPDRQPSFPVSATNTVLTEAADVRADSPNLNFEDLPVAACSVNGLSYGEKVTALRLLSVSAEFKWGQRVNEFVSTEPTAEAVLNKAQQSELLVGINKDYLHYELYTECLIVPETDSEMEQWIGAREAKLQKDEERPSLEKTISDMETRFRYCKGISRDRRKALDNLAKAAQSGFLLAVLDFAEFAASDDEETYAEQHPQDGYIARTAGEKEELTRKALFYLKDAYAHEFSPAALYLISKILSESADGNVEILIEALSYFEVLKRVVPTLAFSGDYCDEMRKSASHLTSHEQIQAMELAKTHFNYWHETGGINAEILDRNQQFQGSY